MLHKFLDRIHTYTHTHTDTQRERRTRVRHRHRPRDFGERVTHTHIHTRTHTHIDTQSHTRAHIHTQSHTRAHTSHTPLLQSSVMCFRVGSTHTTHTTRAIKKHGFLAGIKCCTNFGSQTHIHTQTHRTHRENEEQA